MSLSKSARFVRNPTLALGIVILAMLSAPSSPNRYTGHGLAAPVTGNLLALYGADAVTLDRNARDFKALEQVHWEGRQGSDAQTATVFGDPSKPEMYVQLLKRGPNNWSQP